MVNLLRRHGLLIVVCFTLFTLYAYKVTSSYHLPVGYNYDSDFGRDLMVMWQIGHGHLTLLGPQLSFGGLHLGPYYFYLFAPFLLFGGYRYDAVQFANALFFALSLGFFFVMVQRRNGTVFALLSSVWIATAGYFLLAARSPSNAFSYVPLLLVYLTLLLYKPVLGATAQVGLGLLGGIIVNFHPLTLPVVVLAFAARIVSVKAPVKSYASSLAVFLLAFAATFLPVLVFELKHGFVVSQSVLNPQNRQTIGSNVGHTGLIQNIMSTNTASMPLLSMTLLGSIGLLLIGYLTVPKNRIVTAWAVAGIIAPIFLLLTGTTVPHYLLAYLLLAQIVAVWLVGAMRLKIIIMLALLALNLLFFPKQLYQPARNLAEVDLRLSAALRTMPVPLKPLAVALVNDTNLSIIGYEYRFLLAKRGFVLAQEKAYNRASYLLLISEKGMIDWLNFKTWEIDQFGPKQLADEVEVDNTVYYLFRKLL